MRSKIIISSDFEQVKKELFIECDPEYLRIFEFESALVEDAHEIIAEAYIAEPKEKVIAIFARKFGTEWQSALLKIFEEPPRNVVFVLVSPAKNLLIPTVRSRLVLETRENTPKRVSSGLDVKRLDLRHVYEFLENAQALERADKLGKNELLTLVKAIVCELLDAGIKFESEDLAYFSRLYTLASLNAKSATVLTPLLLLAMKRVQ